MEGMTWLPQAVTSLKAGIWDPPVFQQATPLSVGLGLSWQTPAEVTLLRVLWSSESRRWVPGVQEQEEPWSCLVLPLSLPLLECLSSGTGPGERAVAAEVPRNIEVLLKYRASWF